MEPLGESQGAFLCHMIGVLINKKLTLMQISEIRATYHRYSAAHTERRRTGL